MNNKLWLIVGIIAVLIIVPVVLFVFNKNKEAREAYSSENEQEKAENDKVITKTYTGTFPCADCTGVETSLSLSQKNENTLEGTFTMAQQYLGRENDILMASGNWTTQRGNVTNPDATIITLNPEDEEKAELYLQVDAIHLEKLDKEGNKMTPAGSYILTLFE